MLLTTVPCLQPHLTALVVRLQKIPTATRLASLPAGCSETAYSAGQLSLKWQLRECRLATPASGKLRWAEHESEPSQGYLMRSGECIWRRWAPYSRLLRTGKLRTDVESHPVLILTLSPQDLFYFKTFRNFFGRHAIVNVEL